MKTTQAFILLAILVLLQSCYKEPVANFKYTYKESMAPAMVTFENLSTDADKFIWDFGDGSTGNEKSPVHEYYSFVKPIVSMQASGRGGENMTSQTLGITAYYVKNSLSITLYDSWSFNWDGENIIDDMLLGTLNAGSDSESVITNHDLIHVSFEVSDGTVYITDPGFDLIVDGYSYIEIDGETTVREVTAKKKGTLSQDDLGMLLGSGEKIKMKDLIVR